MSQVHKQRATPKRETEDDDRIVVAAEAEEASQKFDALLAEIDDLLGTEEEGQALVSQFVQASGQ